MSGCCVRYRTGGLRAKFLSVNGLTTVYLAVVRTRTVVCTHRTMFCRAAYVLILFYPLVSLVHFEREEYTGSCAHWHWRCVKAVDPQTERETRPLTALCVDTGIAAANVEIPGTDVSASTLHSLFETDDGTLRHAHTYTA